jgi:alanine racemase
VEVSRARIAANYAAVQAAVGPAVEVLGVVKADAYGHGAAEVSKCLTAAGARWLAVSSVEEGVALRKARIDARILVMGGFFGYEEDAIEEHALTPVVHNLKDIERLRDRAIRFHLKIDSGMNRMGSPAPAAEIAAAVRAAGTQCEGLMTHFSSAADYSSSETARQMERFQAACVAVRQAGPLPRYLHLASTNAIAYDRRDAWQNMVRPGHAIYGYVSPARGESPARILDVKPALSWKARIALVKDVAEGAPIGYGASFRAPRPMRIGVLSVGYADGFPHRLSNKGKVIAAGRYAPVVGTVSMDLTTVDLTNAPELTAGDAVTLLGEEGGASLDAQQIAKMAGTISYSVLCGISARVKRVYV